VEVKASLDDPAVVEALIERVSAGESISAICASKDMPSARAVYSRMGRDDQFCAVIARAREAQQESEMDACIDMADKATPEDWQVVKLRIWARQWRASKLAPKKYGERVDMNLSGSVQTMPQEALDARITELLGKAGVATAARGDGTEKDEE